MSNDLPTILERLAVATEGIHQQLCRLADHFDPPPPDIVGTKYIADRLGCTQIWVTRMAGRGVIPRSCIVIGTGNGKVWKFYRSRVEKWLETR